MADYKEVVKAILNGDGQVWLEAEGPLSDGVRIIQDALLTADLKTAFLSVVDGIPPPPPPPSTDPIETFVVNTDKLNIRPTPSTKLTAIGTVVKGDTVEIQGNIQDTNSTFHFALLVSVNGLKQTTTGYVAREYLKPVPPPPPPTKPDFPADYGPQFLYGKYDSNIARRYKYVKVISNPGGLVDAHSYHPEGLFIHRTFYEGSIADYIAQRGGTPESAADHWMAENAEALALCPWAYHEGMNEQTQTDLEIAFEIARVTRLKAKGIKACVLNRGVGWTSDDLWTQPAMLTLLALCQETGSIIGVHCYGEGIISASSGDHYWNADGSWSKPGDPLPSTIDPKESFLALRVVRDMQIVKALGFNVQFVGTEVGCDDCGKPYPHGVQTRGWKSCVQIWQSEGWLNSISGGDFYLKSLRWWCDMTRIPGFVYGSGDTTDAEHYPPGVFDTVGLL